MLIKQIKILITILVFTFFNIANAENYIKNISEISKIAENTVNAAAKQISSDTDKVLKDLEARIEDISSNVQLVNDSDIVVTTDVSGIDESLLTSNAVAQTLGTSIVEAKNAIEFAKASLENGNLSAAVQSLNLVESIANLAINSIPSNNTISTKDIKITKEFSKDEISALASVTGQMAVKKVLEVQKIAGQINVVEKGGLDTTSMMKNLDNNGVGIGSTITSLDTVGAVSIEKITGNQKFEVENFNSSTFSSMDVVEIGMDPTMMHGALNSLPIGSATKALETISTNPEKLSINIDSSLITSQAVADTIFITSKSIANTMTKKGLSKNTLINLNNDLKLDGINSAIDDSQNSNSLENLSEVIQNSGIENVSKNLELAFSNNKLGITEEISKSAQKISNALSKKSKNDKKVEDNTTLQNVELPENISDTSVIVGAAVLSKPNLSSGVQGIVAPPEGLTSNSLISDDEIAISENLAEVDQTLITSNAMADTLGAMTKLKASELNELGIEKLITSTGLTPGMVASLGSAGIVGLDITDVMANNVAGIGSSSIKKISKSITEGNLDNNALADLVLTGSINQGTLAIVGESGVKALSSAMGINNDNNSLVSLSGGLVGSGVLENIQNINPEVVKSLGIDTEIITTNAIAETLIGVDLVKMSSALSNGMNLTDALNSSSLIDISDVENNLSNMALSQTMSSSQLINDVDVKVTTDISGIDPSLITSNAMAETLGQAAENMKQGLDANAPTNQPGYNAIDPNTGNAPIPPG